MQALLDTLSGQLALYRPDYWASLQPPLAEGAIERLFQAGQLPLPPDLRTLYRWRNGQTDTCSDSFAANYLWLPLEAAFDVQVELLAFQADEGWAPNTWPDSWLPLFDNGGGDYLCYDLAAAHGGAPGQLVAWWHDEPYRTIEFPSITSFLTALSRLLVQIGPDAEEPFALDAPKGFPKPLHF